MIRYFFSAVLLLVFTASCIPTKKLIYLQEGEQVNDSLMEVSKLNIKPYRVQSLDILSIILKAPDEKLVQMFEANSGDGELSLQSMYFNGFSVDDEGFIRVPVLGKIQVLGLTLDEIRLKIEKLLLKDYFNTDAHVYVDVKLPGVYYTINGEINAPGPNVVYKDRATILEAIAASGDILVTGDRKEVVIIRQYPHGAEMHSIDLTMKEAMLSPYYFVQPNDYIYIKPLKQKAWGTGINGRESITTFFQIFTIAASLIVLITNLK